MADKRTLNGPLVKDPFSVLHHKQTPDHHITDHLEGKNPIGWIMDSGI
jgi:hypothetical protein